MRWRAPPPAFHQEISDLVEAVYVALKHDRVSDAARLAAIAFGAEPNEATRTAMAEAMIREGRFVEADARCSQVRFPTMSTNGRDCGGSSGDPRISSGVSATPPRRPGSTWSCSTASPIPRPCSGSRPISRGSRTATVVHPKRSPAPTAWSVWTTPDVRFAMAAARAPALVLCGRVDDAVELAKQGWDEGWGADTEFGSHGQHLIALGYGKLYAGDLETARFVAQGSDRCMPCQQRDHTAPLLPRPRRLDRTVRR